MKRVNFGETTTESVKPVIVIYYITGDKFAPIYRGDILPMDSRPYVDNISTGVRKLPVCRQKAYYIVARSEADMIAEYVRVQRPVIPMQGFHVR